jgi:hypothetical protein
MPARGVRPSKQSACDDKYRRDESSGADNEAAGGSAVPTVVQRVQLSRDRDRDEHDTNCDQQGRRADQASVLRAEHALRLQIRASLHGQRSEPNALI